MDPSQSLLREIARNAAMHAVQAYGRHLPLRKQRVLKRRFFDSAFAVLLVYEEIAADRRLHRPIADLMN